MSIWDTITSIASPQATSKKAGETPAAQSSWNPLGLFGDGDGAIDQRPWWQRLGELQSPTSAPAITPATDPSADPAIAPTSDPTIDPTIDPASNPASDLASEPGAEPAPSDAEQLQARAEQKARAMMTRSFQHTEDFDDFLFGTSPEELAVVRAEYDRLVADAKSADDTCSLTSFDTRFAAFAADDKRWARMASVDQEKVSESVVAIFNACDGMGTDENAIISNLRGKTPDEIAEIKRVFAATYPGVDLEHVLEDEMDGDYSVETTALLTGDEVTAAAVGLQNAMWGIGTDTAKIEDILRGIPADKRKEVFDQFQGSVLFGSFEAELAMEVGGIGESSKFEGLKALGAGEMAKGDAYLIDYELNGGLFGYTGDSEKQRVEKLLEDSTDDAAVADAYATLSDGTELSTEMDDEFVGTDRDVMTTLMDTTSSADEKKAKIATARILRGLDNSDGKLDKKAVLDELANARGAEREMLLAELQFNTDYMALVADAQNTPPEQRNDAASFLLKFNALQAPETDQNVGVFEAALQGDLDDGSVDAAKTALAGMTKAQIDAQPELVAKLVDEVSGSGREEFEVQQLLLGKPEGDPAEVMAELHRREQQAYTWERGDGSWFTDMFSDAGGHLDERHARSEQRFETLMADGATEADTAELERELGYTNAARSSYGTRKDQIADTTSTVVAAAALAAGTLATGGLLSVVAPYLGTFGTSALANAAVISNMGGALIGGAAGMGTKWALKDDAYGSDEALKDGALTLVNMAAAGVSQAKWLDKWAEGSGAVKGAVTGFVGGVGSGVVNTVANGELDPAAFTLGTLGQMGGGALGNVVGGAIENRLLPFPETASVWKLLGMKSVAGAGGGLAGGAVQGVMDPGSYEGDTGEFLTKMGLAGMGGAFGNIAQGLGEGFGLRGADAGMNFDELLEAVGTMPAGSSATTNQTSVPDAPLTQDDLDGIIWPPGMGSSGTSR